MIDENLCRFDLSPSERAWSTDRRKAIYVKLHPETEHGLAGAVGKHGAVANLATAKAKADRFTKDTAKRTGRSERSIHCRMPKPHGQEIGQAATRSPRRPGRGERAGW